MTTATIMARTLSPERRVARRKSRGVSPLSRRLGLTLAGIVGAVIIVGLLKGDPNTMHMQAILQAPSWQHPFGTDAYGRDQLARVAAGGIRSLSAAGLVLAVSMAGALALGIVAGLIGGVVDAVVSRSVDALLAIPSLVLAIGIIGAFGSGFLNLVLALSASYLAVFTRMTRAFTLASGRRDDVTAARLAGVRWTRTVGTHILPAVFIQLSAVATLALGDIIISIAGLSFLGLGVQPPTPEWGSMLDESRSAFGIAPWLLVIPAVIIMTTVMSANLFSDSLREEDR
jgi:ABC-type dipeptide/oligopeptide/nickel transport system permease subunit